MMIRLHARHNHMDQARGLFFEMQDWRYGYHILDSSIFVSHLCDSHVSDTYLLWNYLELN
jgi:pentatricopeptide repeat protein